MTEKIPQIELIYQMESLRRAWQAELITHLETPFSLMVFFLWHPIIPHNETATKIRAGSFKQMHKTNTNLSKKKNLHNFNIYFRVAALTHTHTQHTQRVATVSSSSFFLIPSTWMTELKTCDILTVRARASNQILCHIPTNLPNNRINHAY